MRELIKWYKGTSRINRVHVVAALTVIVLSIMTGTAFVYPILLDVFLSILAFSVVVFVYGNLFSW